MQSAQGWLSALAIGVLLSAGGLLDGIQSFTGTVLCLVAVLVACAVVVINAIRN